jgi:hypothetical protein
VDFQGSGPPRIVVQREHVSFARLRAGNGEGGALIEQSDIPIAFFWERLIVGFPKDG